MNVLRRIQTRVLEQWERFRLASPNQRLLVLVALVLGILVLVLLGSRLFATTWSPVFTNLQSGDAATIAADLKAAAIPYQVSADGTTITVPAQDAGQARLAVAGKGALPSSGINWDIFTQSGLSQLGMSTFQRQVLYTQALENDLSQNIGAMQGVAVARVNLVIPQDSVFTTQSPPASAAVFLTVKPWAQIGGPEVAGIINLVTHAVPGLSNRNVTVIDNSGQVLLPTSPSAQGSNTGSDLTQEIAFEHHLENNLNAVLEPVLGPGNVVARVTANMNFNQSSITQRRFTPVSAKTGQGLLQSLNQMKETFQGNGNAPLPTGLTGNGGTPVYPTATGGTSNYSKTQTSQNWANNETVTQTQVAPGAVNRLTVAVMVNRQLTAVQAQAIRSTVAAAIGYDPARKDLISVVGMPFNTSLSGSLARAAQQEQQLQLLAMLLPWGVATLLILGLFLLVWRWRRQSLEAQRGREEALLLEEAQARLASPSVEDGADSRRQEHIRALTRQQPENVAEVVRAWLREE